MTEPILLLLMTLAIAVVVAALAGAAALALARADGASYPTALTRAGTAFAGTLTLLSLLVATGAELLAT